MTIAADSTSRSEQPGTLSQRTRRKIIEVATEIFLSTGFSNASMDMVARKTSVSKNTIYNHFNNKGDLFGAIITDLCENLLAPLRLLIKSGCFTCLYLAQALQMNPRAIYQFILS